MSKFKKTIGGVQSIKKLPPHHSIIFILVLIILGISLVTYLFKTDKIVEAYRDTGGYFTTPVLADDGTIYVGARNFYAYALNPDPNASVRVKWKYKTGNDILGTPAKVPANVPGAGSVYFGSTNGILYALDQNNGQLLWQYDIGNPIHSGAAISDDGTIIVGNESRYLYALQPNDPTNHLKWKLYMPHSQSRFKPILLGENKRVYLGLNGGGMYSVELLSTPKILWSFDVNVAYRTGGVIGPDKTLYVSGADKIVALQPDGKQIWSYRIVENLRSSPILSPDGKTVYQGSRTDNMLHAVDAATGALRWTYNAGGNIVATGAVHPLTGVIYIGSTASADYFHAVNPDGSLKWKIARLGGIRSTPTLSSDLSTLYIGDENGTFLALNPETGQTIWSYDTHVDK